MFRFSASARELTAREFCTGTPDAPAVSVRDLRTQHAPKVTLWQLIKVWLAQEAF